MFFMCLLFTTRDEMKKAHFEKLKMLIAFLWEAGKFMMLREWEEEKRNYRQWGSTGRSMQLFVRCIFNVPVLVGHLSSIVMNSYSINCYKPTPFNFLRLTVWFNDSTNVLSEKQFISHASLSEEFICWVLIEVWITMIEANRGEFMAIVSLSVISPTTSQLIKTLH